MQKEKLGFYLYCFYRGGGSLPDLVGIDGDHKVFALRYGDLNAAVSLVPLEEFGARPLEQRMAELNWIAPRVIVHERIIEEIMTAHPVIPVRFCTIFASGDRIEELLGNHRAKIIRFFSDIADNEEWGVKGYINGGQVEDALKRLSPRVQAIETKLQEASPGKAYLLGKKRDLAIKDGLTGKVLQIAEEVFQRLLAHAIKGVKNRPFKLEDEETREMILNAAYLVRKSDLRIFHEKVKKTEEKYHGRGFNLNLTGPWPPYNFCPVFGDEISVPFGDG